LDQRQGVAGEVDPEDARGLPAAEGSELTEAEVERGGPSCGNGDGGLDGRFARCGCLAEELEGEVDAFWSDPAEASKGGVALKLMLELGEGGENGAW
jgi:hypothetical protein